jgi:hypothetical protein
MVKKYYPVTEEMRIDLAKLSQALAFTFQITVLEEKLAANALDIALEMENEFLERYFGTNSKIHDFVRDAVLLVLSKYRFAGFSDIPKCCGGRAGFVSDLVESKLIDCRQRPFW